MECPNCNKTYEYNFKFCPYCGFKNPEEKICPKCKFKSIEYSHCPHCGEKLIPIQLLQKKKYAKKNNLKNKVQKNSEKSHKIELYNYLNNLDNVKNRIAIERRIRAGEITKIEEIDKIRIPEKFVKRNPSKSKAIMQDLERKKSLKNYVNQISISEQAIKYDLLDKIERGNLTTTIEIMNEIKRIENMKKTLTKKKKGNEKDRLKRIVDNGFVGNSYRSIHNYSKELMKKEIEYGILTKEYEIYSKISSEAKKKSLYSYLDKLHILAYGSSLNYPIKEELKNLIYAGKLLTESEIDIEKENIIKKKVEAMNKKKSAHYSTSRDSSSYSEHYHHSHNSQIVIIPDHKYWKDAYH